MEITKPDADKSSPWYVSNGLLVVKMVTGRSSTVTRNSIRARRR
jgi:hypothetical protein